MKRFMAKLGSDKPASGQPSGQQYAPPPGNPPPRQYAPPVQQQYAPPAQQQYSAPAQPPSGGYVPPGAAIGSASGEDPLAALRRYDMVFIVDDSESMEMVRLSRSNETDARRNRSGSSAAML